MSSHHLRKEKNCLNCGNTVEERYCGKCGQENIEPRQTFGHLVAHFFEDLTHYEGKFWGTLRYLFFRPAYLTKEFIAGKRSKYVPPVRLYIFVSFITFLLLALVPDSPVAEKEGEEHDTSTNAIHDSLKLDTKKHTGDSVKQGTEIAADSLDKRENKKDSSGAEDISMNTEDGFSFPGWQKTMEALDSAKKARANTDDPMWYLTYKLNKNTIRFKKYPAEVREEIIAKALYSNIPKTLFISMPFFALILRLFHRKRNWIYFDHGIFTLHFFSFALLALLVLYISVSIIDWIGYFAHNDPGWLTETIKIAMGGWIAYYFFRAHRRMYEESVFVSMVKVWGILLMSSVLYLILIAAHFVITFLTVH